MASQLTSLPNLLTYGRIVAIPVICWLVAVGDPTLRWIGFVIYVLAAVSDWLDGYLARRLGQGSPLGVMLDPIADKLLVGALLVIFAWTRDFDHLDLIPAIAILLREIFIPGLREFLGNKAVGLPVTALAKWKTTVQLVALGVVMLQTLLPGLAIPADVALWLAGILTVWTGIDYFRSAWPHLSGSAK
jgi:cardiolipin synthase